MIALSYKMAIDGARNEPETVVADAQNALTIGLRHGMDFFVANSRVYLNWAQGRLGDARLGADELRKSLAVYRRQGNRLAIPRYLGLLAELESAAGNHEGALALIDEGLALGDETGEHLADSPLHRLRGEILLKGAAAANRAASESALKTAMAIAKKQEARSYSLLASMSLAKLFKADSLPAEALAILAPTLEGFTPTPEMPQIAEAEALLDHLRRACAAAGVVQPAAG